MKTVALSILVFFLAAFAPDTNTITLTTGEYGVVDLHKGKNLIIDGNVKVGNINISGNNTITITNGSILDLNGSLHQNGNVKLYNNGTINAGNYEAQNGNNKFYNNGIFTGKVGQITDCSSKIINNGSMSFKSFQANCGYIEINECAKFETKHLDVNYEKIFKGSGFLSVLNSMNANKRIGHDGLHFYYPHNADSKKTKGLILVKKDWICSALPVVWESIKFTKNSVDFSVTEPEGIEYVEIEVSTDGINWKTVKRATTIKENNHIKL